MNRRSKKMPVIAWIGIALVALIIGALAYESYRKANNIVESPADVVRISAIETVRTIEKGEAILLDTRDAGSYAAQHAQDAISFPLADVEARLGELDPQQYYITYCT